jgi:ABC-type transport system involved in multi-copper enzyme maturation permease subunit
VHELIWSKLIVSLVWFFATALFIFLILTLTGLNLSGTNLEMIISEFPSWSEISQMLDKLGIRNALSQLMAWGAVVMLLGAIVSCLHFYGAMALGHMFSKNKVLLSVVFFILISFAFNTMEMSYGLSGIAMDAHSFDVDTARDGIRFASRICMHATVMELVQGAVLYLATALGLKRGLNLE